jgi:hypothetical protein
MPFIKQDRRSVIDEHGKAGFDMFDLQVGDICYYYYKPMVDAWKKSPRWTTAHNLYKDVQRRQGLHQSAEEKAAESLAWQVFFQLYVMPYELQKRHENGDI